MTWLLMAAVAVAVTILGPLALLPMGVESWPFVAGVTGLMAACGYVSRLTWRRWPDDEWFAVWLIAAALIWTGSGWLGIAVVTI